MTILLFFIGLALILKGGDYFVSSSVAIAEHARVPRMVIGTTIVSMATTSPEFFVSTTASLTGRPGIAIGNAVGSAILNIGLILAVACLIKPIAVERHEFRFPSTVLIGSAALLALLTAGLTLSRASGLLLVVLGLLYISFDYFRHKRRTPEPSTEASTKPAVDPRMRSLRRAGAFFFLGLAAVIVGSRLLIGSAVKVASYLGVPPVLIGFTLVALGTSLPELVTALTSFRKGVADLSLGNIVGAGVLNCTVITGAAAAIRPLTMTRTTQMYNLPALLVVGVTLVLLARAGSDLSRRDGAILLSLYVAYVAGLVLLRGG